MGEKRKIEETGKREETKKLYDMDAYATEFDACVLSCEAVGGEENRYQAVLDQTLFFPEEGGQSPDKGILGGQAVLDVQLKNGLIVHTLPAPLSAGEKVHGSIDWEHRFYNMQQHSGEHIFSGLVCRKFGYDNVGFHLSNQIVTMDFNGVLSKEEAEGIEWEANQIIIQNIPIQITFPSKQELAALEYRSKIEIEGQVRIVTIPGVDACACCAPHLRRTGEVGLLKIMDMQHYKGGVRISILCGFRALKDYRERIGVISELSALLSANQESLAAAANKLKEANQALKYDLTAEKRRYLSSKIEGIPKKQQNACLFEEGLDAQVMRSAVNQLTAVHPGICAVFSGSEEAGYQFIIGSSKEDAREFMLRLKESFGARGGGSAAMVQGSVKAGKEALLQCMNL